MKVMSKRQWRKKFEDIMRYCDEDLLPNTTTDYIQEVFKAQGFWSGVYVRIYENNGIFTYKEKTYG